MNAIEGEARTRIIWGERPADIIEFLSENGYPSERAEKLVKLLLEERYRIIRRRGLHRGFLGVIVSTICAWVLTAMLPMDSAAGVFSGGRFPGAGLGALALGFFWGMWKFMDGLRDLLRPKDASGDLGFHGEQV